MKLIYERSKPGRRASAIPRHDGLPAPEVPEELRRSQPARLPEVPEFELVRHFTELSTRNFGIDNGFYPLGSCTMKYNPRVNERLVALAGFAHLHPLQEEDGAQGALELEWRLQEMLAEVTGLDAVSLQPAAGSQGELTGLMLVRAHFVDKGEAEQRTKVVIPDTAHQPAFAFDSSSRRWPGSSDFGFCNYANGLWIPACTYAGRSTAESTPFTRNAPTLTLTLTARAIVKSSGLLPTAVSTSRKSFAPVPAPAK